jgi:hypothetical protein
VSDETIIVHEERETKAAEPAWYVLTDDDFIHRVLKRIRR